MRLSDLCGAWVAFMLMVAPPAAMAQGQVDYLIGTYSDKAAKPSSRGMTLLTFEATTGKWQNKARFRDIDNASFILHDPQKSIVYVTDERETSGRIGAFQLSADHKTLTPLGYVSSMNGSPCYLALSPGRTHLAVANYASDSVAVYRLDSKSGAITGPPQILRGGVAARPGHAHWVQWAPEGDKLYVVDLGHDDVRMHSFDSRTGVIGPTKVAVKLAGAATPRHMAFHPRGGYAYVLSEHTNRLTALKRQADGTLTPFQTLSTLPVLSLRKSFAAHIAINARGDTLYVSNRGHNSIASFRIGKDGRLKALQTIATGGDWPRYFLLDETSKRLLVANQDGNSLTVFAVAADGRLSRAPKPVGVSKPVAIVRLTP